MIRCLVAGQLPNIVCVQCSAMPIIALIIFAQPEQQLADEFIVIIQGIGLVGPRHSSCGHVNPTQQINPFLTPKCIRLAVPCTRKGAMSVGRGVADEEEEEYEDKQNKTRRLSLLNEFNCLTQPSMDVLFIARLQWTINGLSGPNAVHCTVVVRNNVQRLLRVNRLWMVFD